MLSTTACTMPQKGYKKTEEEKQKDREAALKRSGKDIKYITETHPEIAKEWHPTKNGELKPDHFTHGSDKLVWWLCPKTCKEGCPHAYPAPIGNRTRGSDCPYCSGTTGKVCCVHDSIVTTHPEIAKEWHPTKNGDLKPEEVSHGSKKDVWWLCSKTCPEGGCLHEYPATPNNRCGVNKQNCSFCCNQRICIHSSIAYTHPSLAEEWHPTKNGDKLPSQFPSGSSSEIWWICRENHEYKAILKNRAGRCSGCPTCKHKTERKLFEYLLKLIPDIRMGDRIICPGRVFDIVSHDRKVIFELDGPQHFVIIPLWKNDPDANQDADVHKMKMAISKGYRIIRVLQEDVLKHDEAWLDTHLKPLIERGEPVEYISPYNEHMYDNHRVKMEK
jgi:very-short-patch-repair endonuclease